MTLTHPACEENAPETAGAKSAHQIHIDISIIRMNCRKSVSHQIDASAGVSRTCNKHAGRQASRRLILVIATQHAADKHKRKATNGHRVSPDSMRTATVPTLPTIRFWTGCSRGSGRRSGSARRPDAATLDCDPRNTKLCAYYEALGFERVALRPLPSGDIASLYERAAAG
ncbi:TPA: hypothetical protein ACK3Q6_008277 [Burkholderia cepacia]|uniref:hypothetical protein n=1 Tax=Burkholderia cepacia TaxID=292 RepID=UPI001CF4657D|nr:hypothetical protein [Burkholderia cepacia]MCA8358468.1 hypothetical protein [Burkholderia cepacia]HDR9761056.1 hypothetical protein [Burkholderia cepacia ATCC 25416]HDV6370337.1 hypothetical protein [Burkholderia cepacia]